MNRKLLLAAWIMMAPLLLVTEVVGQASRNPRNNPERTRYVVIPINGMLGGSTVAAGVERAIDQALSRPDHNCFIFTFDTTGGDADEALRITQIINRKTAGADVIGIVKQCLGPGLAILLSCDQIYIEEPLPRGIVIEFQDSWLADSGSDQHNLRRQQALYRQLVQDKPAWIPIINALTDPDTTLYAWDTGSGQIMTSNSKPAANVPDWVEIDLTQRLGMTAEEAISAGLANPAVGGIPAIGASLGYSLFQESSVRGANLMEQASSESQKQELSIDRQITETFEMLANAQSLSGELSRMRYRAINNGNEEGSNSRRYSEGRWNFSNNSGATRQNRSEQSRDRWGQVINALDQIQELERNARKSIGELEKVALDWPSDDPRHQAIGLLNEELSELREDSYKLGNMRDEASFEFEIQDERANPRYVDNSSYRRIIINNRSNGGWGRGWGWGGGLNWGITGSSNSTPQGFTPYQGGGGISTTR